MKSSLVPILALVAALPTLALPEPVAAVPANIQVPPRAGIVTKVDGLCYYTCPRTSCWVIGTYQKGTHIGIKCYTRHNTSSVNGDQ